jgi:hypothetical protein
MYDTVQKWDAPQYGMGWAHRRFGRQVQRMCFRACPSATRITGFGVKDTAVFVRRRSG